MTKKKIFPQLTILSSGVFANILLTIIFFFLLMGFFNVAYSPAGVIFSDYSYTVGPTSILLNSTITNQTLQIEGSNLTRVIVNKDYYFVRNEFIGKNSTENYIQFYYDFPAIRNNVFGYIVEIDGQKINVQQDISKVLTTKAPGDNIILKTQVGNETKTYSFALGADYSNESRAVMGIASSDPSYSNSLRGIISRFMANFKEDSIHYEAKSNPELSEFVYYLLWWIFIINFSVAIVNMLPLGIFDGGRFFYLTVLAVTRDKKFSEKAFKYVTWFLLLVVAIMMALYFWGIF
jgi:membrane-associated protease RseP (regulator of RpoE activity)